MNDFFDPTNTDPINTDTDAQMHATLQTLPEAPEHGDDFWATLDAELPAAAPAAPSRRSFDGRSQFLLVAAALVIVAGVIGVTLNNRGVGEIDTANDPTTTIENTTPETTAPDDLELDPNNSAPAQTEEEQQTTTVPDATNAERAASDLFLYDVAVPAGFSVDYATGQGVSLSHTTDPFNAYLQVTNYVGGDNEWQALIQPYGDGETTNAIASITTSLFDQDGSAVVESDQSIEATQYEFVSSERSRWVRVFEFDDRTIVAELVYSDPSLIGEDLTAPLDDIRHFTGAFQPIETCSTNGLDVIAAPAELNAAQAARFDGIMTALVTCDWDLLEAQFDPTGFFPTVGGGDAIEIWQDQEAFDEPTLKLLYDHLTLPLGIDADGRAQFPRAWNGEEPLDAETSEALRAIGYTDGDFDTFEEIGYLGYRTSLGSNGEWTFFVAGD